MNALLGGSLYQDIAAECPTLHAPNHVMDFAYDWVAHFNSILTGSPLYERLGVNFLGVNSLHHQAVKKLAESLKPMAVSEDGLVEAAYAPAKKFLWAVQWHPEYSYTYDGLDMAIFEAFTEAAGSRTVHGLSPFLPPDLTTHDTIRLG